MGLHDPRNEYDACGVGCVVNVKDRKSYRTITQSLNLAEDAGFPSRVSSIVANQLTKENT
jgi:glutamate synthase (NADPH/NADH) large chain